MVRRLFDRDFRWLAMSAALLASCGGDFSTAARNDGGAGDGGTPGTGGTTQTGGTKATGGRPATGGKPSTGGVTGSGGAPGSGGTQEAGGTPGTGGVTSSGGTPATGGIASSGGSPSTGGVTASGGTIGTGGARATGGVNASGGVAATGGNNGTGGGTCGTLIALTFVDGDFESGDVVDTPPVWEGAPNPPYYSAVSTAAAHTGAHGVEFNDTGTGVPGIQQLIPLPASVVGKTVTVTAWFKLVSFPSMRLFLSAESAANTHLALDTADTDPAVRTFQQLKASVQIPASADHLLLQLASAVSTGDGVAYGDDVVVCVDGLCSACPLATP